MSLQSFVAQSSLLPEQKEMWKEVFSIVDDEQVEMFAEFVEDDEERLNFLTENIEKKKNALESGDVKHLDEILQDERKALLSVTDDKNNKDDANEHGT